MGPLLSSVSSVGHPELLQPPAAGWGPREREGYREKHLEDASDAITVTTSIRHLVTFTMIQSKRVIKHGPWLTARSGSCWLEQQFCCTSFLSIIHCEDSSSLLIKPLRRVNQYYFLIQGAPECCHHDIVVLHGKKWIYFCNVYVSLWESEITVCSLWVRVNWGTEHNIRWSHCSGVPLWDMKGLFCQSIWHFAGFSKLSDVLWTSVHAAWQSIGQRTGKSRGWLLWAPRKWICN